MNILQISAYPPEHPGGSERYAFLLSKFLSEQGHKVKLLTSGLKNRTLCSLEGHENLVILRSFCAGEVFSVNPLTFMLPKLLREVKWADVVHAHGEFFITTMQAAFVKTFLHYPLVIQIHGSMDYPKKCSMLMRAKRDIYDPTVSAWIFRQASIVLSISKKNIQLIKRMFSLPDEKMFQLPNAIDVDNFKCNPNKTFSYTVAFVGRLVPWKGIEVFIRAAKDVLKENKNANFVIIGDGPLLSFYKNSSTCKSVHFAGACPPEQMSQMLDSIDILVVPSYLENVPTIILEAMAKEIPVIASNVGGIPEVVTHGKTGYLITPGDSKSCAALISHLLENPEEAKKLGKNAQMLVETHHDIKKIGRMALDLYSKIL